MRKRASAAELIRADSDCIRQLPISNFQPPRRIAFTLVVGGWELVVFAHTDAGATPGCAINASRAASLNGWSGGRTTAADRTRWCSSETPGGVTPCSVNALIARSSF